MNSDELDMFLRNLEKELREEGYSEEYIEKALADCSRYYG